MCLVLKWHIAEKQFVRWENYTLMLVTSSSYCRWNHLYNVQYQILYVNQISSYIILWHKISSLHKYDSKLHFNMEWVSDEIFWDVKLVSCIYFQDSFLNFQVSFYAKKLKCFFVTDEWWVECCKTANKREHLKK